MAETPDFDLIAWTLLEKIVDGGPLIRENWRNKEQAHSITEQLYIAWNARGAADIQAVNDDLAFLGSAGVSPGFRRAIGNLDR